ncbi:hypothetical protein [Streptomyces malaysiensis]|uniref:hypothetical protein n=1 Tax=Streptomyces malaysiensis TaxID=92644 RepID=UPI001FE80C85|nr:hypothetical protein [Streptomyces solisilvae]
MRLSVRLLTVLRLPVRLLAGCVRRRRAALGRLAVRRLPRVAVAAGALRGVCGGAGGADGGGGGVCGGWPGACGGWPGACG